MRRMLIILHNNIEVGGIEAYLLNTLAWMDFSKLYVDIFVPGKIVSKEIASKFENLGCTIYEQLILGGKIQKGVGLIKKLRAFLKEHSYDIVYVNAGNIVRQAVAISISKRYGIKIRIAHSHNAIFTDSLIKKVFCCVLQRTITKNATHLAACSRAAAIYQFGENAAKRTTIIKNGINTKKFRFQGEKRTEIRKKFNLEGTFVIGHIGRFSAQKNHCFLIDVFREIVRKEPLARLLLVGEGELEDSVRVQVKSYGLCENVIFVGATDQVEDYLCAMDVFVLPSLFEGLPIVGIEAQTSGLPCIISDKVTSEMKVIDWVEFVSLSSGVRVWANVILKYKAEIYRAKREQAYQYVKSSGYDIQETSRMILNII